MKISAEEKEFIENYNPGDFERPSVTVDIIICTIKDGRLQILLIRRGGFPFKNLHALPGGFLDLTLNESLEEAALRELKEETGVSKCFVEQLKTYGDIKRDPRTRVITVAYYALLPYESIEKPVAGDDAKEVGWFDVKNLPKLAFDHKDIIGNLIERLRGKISYTPIGFSLVNKRFTWLELQAVYEALLGKKLLSTNFRRDILRQYNIKETDKKADITTPGKKPALLQFKGQKKVF